MSYKSVARIDQMKADIATPHNHDRPEAIWSSGSSHISEESSVEVTISLEVRTFADCQRSHLLTHTYPIDHKHNSRLPSPAFRM